MNAEIAKLYRVFHSYRLDAEFVGCYCCTSPHESRFLQTTPLGELTIADLDRYAFKAVTTWGDVRHFKHFLPRLLELAYDDYLSFGFPEVLFGKLSYAHWKTWPDDERRAVDAYLQSFCADNSEISSEDFPHDGRIEAVLGGLALACGTLSPFLASWPDVRKGSAALHLARLIDYAADDIMIKGVFQLWRLDNDQQVTEVVDWLRSEVATDMLHRYHGAVTDVFPLVFSQLDGIRTATTT